MARYCSDAISSSMSHASAAASRSCTIWDRLSPTYWKCSKRTGRLTSRNLVRTRCGPAEAGPHHRCCRKDSSARVASGGTNSELGQLERCTGGYPTQVVQQADLVASHLQSPKTFTVYSDHLLSLVREI